MDVRLCSGPFSDHPWSPQMPSGSSPHPTPPRRNVLLPWVHVSEPDRAPGQTTVTSPPTV